MDDDKLRKDKSSSNHASPKSPKSYNLLLKLSRGMGTVAARSYGEARSLLKGEGRSASSERFLNGFAQMRQQRSSTQVESTNLHNAVKQAHEILARANTVFPITLFPDTVLVDRTKVTIIRRNFFWSEDVLSIRIEDVLNVSASVGPLFGSLTIASRVMSTTDHFQINHFWRDDASHLKHIIQGYVIAQHNDIDTAHLSKAELVETLQELGHDSGE